MKSPELERYDYIVIGAGSKGRAARWRSGIHFRTNEVLLHSNPLGLKGCGEAGRLGRTLQ
jgi:hypothetical protein